MWTVAAVFERRRLSSASVCVLLAVCCHAQADSGKAAGGQEASDAPPHLGFVAGDGGWRHTWGGYLLGFRKFFGAEHLFSRLGLFGHDAAGHEGRDAAGSPSMEEASAHAAAARTGNYALNLELPSLFANSAGQRDGRSGLTYIARDELPLYPGWQAHGVKYALYFDECVRLEGLYGRTAGLGRYGLGLGRDNWNVSLAGGAGDGHMSLHLGYAIPLDRGNADRRAACGAGLNAARLSGADAGLLQ